MNINERRPRVNLNVNITSILIVTFANGLGLTVRKHTRVHVHEAHNKHTTALSTVYKSLLVASP